MRLARVVLAQDKWIPIQHVPFALPASTCPSYIQSFRIGQERQKLTLVYYRSKNMEDLDGSSPNCQISFQKVVRLLLVNTQEDLEDMLALLKTLIGNVMESPKDSKFRLLKLTKDIIKRRLVQRNGGVEFLIAAGWIATARDREPVLELPMSVEGIDPAVVDDEKIRLQLENMSLAYEWLLETAKAILMQHTASERKATDACAECIIQLRFANGSRYSGGFMKSDTLSDVRLFAQSFFVADRRADVALRLPDIAAEALDTAADSQTLTQLRLSPRAVLLASTSDDATRAVVFESVHMAAAARTAAVKVGGEDYKDAMRKKAAEREAIAKERTRAVDNFKADRDQFRDLHIIKSSGADNGIMSPSTNKE
jgi:hypothetical protein